MRIRPNVLLIAATLAMASGCVAARLDATENALVDKWMACDECTANERQAVAPLGNNAVPRLRELMLGLPTPREEGIVAQQARTAYRMLSPAGVTEVDFVAMQLANFQARRQTRAALSLMDIHTAAARSVITYSSTYAIGKFRSDVARTIRFLAATWDGTSFGTSLRDVQFGDSIRIANATTPITSTTLVVLDSAPFPPESMLYRRTPDSIVLAAAVWPGAHSIAIVDGSVRKLAMVTVTSDVDLNDRHTRLCTTDVCRVDSAEVITPVNLPLLRFQSLKSVGTRVDTVDFYKIQAVGTPLTVTARLDWSFPGPGTVNLDLRWRTCVGLTPTGNSDGSTPSNKPEVTSLTIPSGECRVLLVIGPRQAGVASVVARLRITSP